MPAKKKKTKEKRPKALAKIKKAIAGAHDATRYLFRLYVTGSSPSSMRAIVNIRSICEEHLRGRYDLEVIDVVEKPALAAGERVFAAPTLIKKLPLPIRRFIGDLSKRDRILLGLDLRGTRLGAPR